MTRRILIAGATGLLGSAAAEHFSAAGDEVFSLVRGESRRPSEIRWDPASGTLDPGLVSGFDAVLNVTGAGIGDRRWTDARKKVLLESRTQPTSVLSAALAATDRPPKVFLSCSASGIYGDHGDELIDETTEHGDDFLARVCRQWEAATAPADRAGLRVVHLRTVPVLTASGGLLGPLLPLFKLGVGGKLGNGSQWMSWIAVDDYVRSLDFLIENDLAGPVNISAPHPVRNTEFTEAFGAALGRPTVLTIPRFAVEIRLGREAASLTAFVSQRVLPGRLRDAGFTFRFGEIGPAFRHVLG